VPIASKYIDDTGRKVSGETSIADGPAGRVLALLRLEDPKRYACVEQMVRDEHVDLVGIMDEIKRGGDPLRIPGIHRRAFIAMEEFTSRENTEILIRRSWWRDREERCRDDSCVKFGSATQNVFFLAYSQPNGWGRNGSQRHVSVAGHLSMDAPICSNDELLISSTSGDGSGRTTFRLYGQAKIDGQPVGMRVNAHPGLYGAVYAFKRAIVGDLAFK